MAGYGSVFYLLPNVLNAATYARVSLTCRHDLVIPSVQRISIETIKETPTFLRGTRMLTISEWIFRMRDNAAMYSLIALVPRGIRWISVMLALSSSFSSIQGMV